MTTGTIWHEAEDGSVDDDSGSGEDQHSGGSGSENESEAGDSSSSDDAPFAPGDAYDDSDYDSENGLHEANASGDRIAELPLAERLQREQYGAGPKQHRRPVVTGLDARDRSALKTRMAAAQAKAKGKSAFQLADIDGSGSGSDGEGEGETDRRHGNSTAGGGGGGGGGGEKSAIPKRANKNQPMEMSSKRAVGRHREVVEVRRRRARDPRFDAATGTLNYDMFRKSYEFLEGYQDGEIDALRKEAAKAKKRRGDGSAERAAAAKALLTKMQQERAERKRADATRAALSQRRKAEAEAVAKGKAPYFMKARDRRALALETRYEELRREGKVQKFVQKKRKRNAAKDRRWMPAKRQNTGGGGGDGGGP
ncbi:testis intracellular mediator protein-like protein [Tribonema minus]|uniref:rRNA biogenesis protein RRP36 n=1 Tax=Tribonema minus TaxID=303371 RepID=A0A835YP85_9STRA|nr:testis intracellular mediator protein-like protein [Tribonema minus]